MTYRITIRSNPRVIGIFIVIPALPAIGVVSFFLLPPIVGVVLTGVGALFSYHLFKLSRSTLQSKVVTSDSSVIFDFGPGHADEIFWEQITHAGTFREPKGKRMVFVYEEPTDRLVTIPDEYESYDQLVEEVRIGTASVFETVDLATQVSLNEYLRSQIELVEQSDEASIEDTSTQIEFTDDDTAYNAADNGTDNEDTAAGSVEDDYDEDSETNGIE